jgi:transposase
MREANRQHRERKREGAPLLTPRLSLTQLRALWWRGATWTGDEFAAAVQEKFGVTYTSGHCRKIMKRLAEAPIIANAATRKKQERANSIEKTEND